MESRLRGGEFFQEAEDVETPLQALVRAVCQTTLRRWHVAAKRCQLVDQGKQLHLQEKSDN